jgi:hypothetical protein
MKLDAHIRNSVKQFKAAALCNKPACNISFKADKLQTWERRLGEGAGINGSRSARASASSLCASTPVGPLYAQVSKDSEDVSLPQVPWAYENVAQELEEGARKKQQAPRRHAQQAM